MAKVIETSIEAFVPDNHNFNKHSEYGMSLLEKSVREFGLGRGIVVDKNNRIIGGNGIAETAGAIDLTKAIVVETNGEQLVVTKRTDIDLDTARGRGMALADNATAEKNLDWDLEAIADVRDAMPDFNPGDWGLKLEEFDVNPDDMGDTFNLPDGSKMHKMTLENNPSRPRPELGGKTYNQVTGGYNFKKYVEYVHGKILPGFQLRYIYFIDKRYRKRLTVPEIPFSQIDALGAGMYKGEKVTQAERHAIKTEGQHERGQQTETNTQ